MHHVGFLQRLTAVMRTAEATELHGVSGGAGLVKTCLGCGQVARSANSLAKLV